MTTRPGSVTTIVVLLTFVGMGGLYGGTCMILAPDGRLLGMENVVSILPTHDLTVPGLMLVSTFGLLPLLLAYGLLRRWSRVDVSLLLFCMVLAAWLAGQSVFIGFVWPIQWMTAAVGLAIACLVLLPSTRAYIRAPQRTDA